MLDRFRLPQEYDRSYALTLDDLHDVTDRTGYTRLLERVLTAYRALADGERLPARSGDRRGGHRDRRRRRRGHGGGRGRRAGRRGRRGQRLHRRRRSPSSWTSTSTPPTTSVHPCCWWCAGAGGRPSRCSTSVASGHHDVARPRLHADRGGGQPRRPRVDRRGARRDARRSSATTCVAAALPGGADPGRADRRRGRAGAGRAATCSPRRQLGRWAAGTHREVGRLIVGAMGLDALPRADRRRRPGDHPGRPGRHRRRQPGRAPVGHLPGGRRAGAHRRRRRRPRCAGSSTGYGDAGRPGDRRRRRHLHGHVRGHRGPRRDHGAQRRARSRRPSRLFEDHVDTTALRRADRRGPADPVTPLMFEHELIERARADRRHIVLPEGNEDRILRAADDPAAPRRRRPDRCSATERDVRGRAPRARASTCRARGSSTRRPRRLRERVRRDLRASCARTRASPLDAGVRRWSPTSSTSARMMVQPGPRRRHGLRRGAHHRRTRSGPAFEIIKTAPGVVGRLQRLLHVPGRPGAGLRRLRGQPRPDAAAARRHRDLLGATPRRGSASSRGSRCCPTRPASRARAPTWRRCARPPRWSASARPDLPVEGPIQYDAAVDAGGRARRSCRQRGRRAGDRVHLPGPQHRQQHLQGGAALGRRGRGRAGAAGPAQAGQRPVARRARCTTSSTPSRSPRSRPSSGPRVEPERSRVLVLNAGSSSVKYQLLDWRDRRPARASGLVERIGEDGPARHRAAGAEPLTERRDRRPRRGAGPGARGVRAHGGLDRGAVAVGHRVVHGGDAFAEPTADRRRRARAEIERAGPARAAAQPGEPRRHRGRPRAAARTCRRSRSSTPRSTRRCRRRAALRDRRASWPTGYGIRRYGFHGTSHALRRRGAAAALLGRPVDELERDHPAPGQRRAAPRRSRGGRQRRHLDGADPAGGPGDGHPLRRPRPGRDRSTCTARAG